MFVLILCWIYVFLTNPFGVSFVSVKRLQQITWKATVSNKNLIICFMLHAHDISIWLLRKAREILLICSLIIQKIIKLMHKYWTDAFFSTIFFFFYSTTVVGKGLLMGYANLWGWLSMTFVLSPHSKIVSPTYGATVYLGGLEPMTIMLLSRTSWPLYYDTGFSTILHSYFTLRSIYTRHTYLQNQLLQSLNWYCAEHAFDFVIFIVWSLIQWRLSTIEGSLEKIMIGTSINS